MVGRDKITTATSSASLYDNVNNQNPGSMAVGPGGVGVGPGGQQTPGKSPGVLKSQDSIKRQDKQQQQQMEQQCQTQPKTANVAIGTSNVGSQVRARRSRFSSDRPASCSVSVIFTIPYAFIIIIVVDCCCYTEAKKRLYDKC